MVIDLHTPRDTSAQPLLVGLGIVTRSNTDSCQAETARSGSERGVEILISRRPEGVVYAGWWEIPGGKVHHGETPEACVVRELREEVGVEVEVVGALPDVVHTYPHATVRLLPRLCRLVPGSPEPRALAVAEVRWAPAADLPAYRFPEANLPIVEALLARFAADR